MLTLILGGSGSGKSEYAEQLSMKLEAKKKLYIATMIPWDEEMKKKIERHTKMRAKKNFETLECYQNLTDVLYPEGISTVLLECMSNLVANVMYSDTETLTDSIYIDSIINGVKYVQQRFENVIIVSNDVFADGLEYSKEMKIYMKNLAEINKALAKEADIVVEVVCNIPLIHKGGTDEFIME